MKQKTRKILFFLCVFLFILSAPVVVLYSQGYRFDFENRKLTQTGGLFLKVIPKDIEIYLEGKSAGKTDFLFGQTLIDNLLPEKYNIKVKKEGYFDWEKNLEIKEKEVTGAKNIVLFPTETNFKLLSKRINNAWFSPDEKRMILKETRGNFWELKLFDLEKNLKSHLLKESDISREGIDIFDLEFSEDGKKIYFDTISKEQLKEELVASLPAIAEQLKTTFALEIDRDPPFLKEAKRPSAPSENILTYQKVNEEIYYLDNSGYLYKADSSFLITENITKIPFPLKQETSYRLYVFDSSIFLIEENKSLYLLNQETGLFENIFEGIKSLKLSSDLKKVAYFSNCEIRILFLEEVLEQPRRKKGEDIFLLRLSDKIKDVFWIRANHLLFVTEHDIKIAEIDNRDMINIIPLAQLSSFTKNTVRYGEFSEKENLKIFWSSVNERIYILANESLWISSKITP